MISKFIIELRENSVATEIMHMYGFSVCGDLTQEIRRMYMWAGCVGCCPALGRESAGGEAHFGDVGDGG